MDNDHLWDDLTSILQNYKINQIYFSRFPTQTIKNIAFPHTPH